MIIERKYELICMLMQRDPESKKLIEKAFDDSFGTRKKERDRILNFNSHAIPAFLTIESGIPGEAYQQILKGLEELDKKSPYDNGLTFKNVSQIEFDTSRKGNAIELRLESIFDGIYRIVGFLTIGKDDNGYKIIKNWDMSVVFPNDYNINFVGKE